MSPVQCMVWGRCCTCPVGPCLLKYGTGIHLQHSEPMLQAAAQTTVHCDPAESVSSTLQKAAVCDGKHASHAAQRVGFQRSRGGSRWAA